MTALQTLHYKVSPSTIPMRRVYLNLFEASDIIAY